MYVYRIVESFDLYSTTEIQQLKKQIWSFLL